MPHRIAPHRKGHIFRDSVGHLTYSEEAEKLLLDLVSNPDNCAGEDKRGHIWYISLTENGEQLWAITRGDEIINGGLNKIPREFNPKSGLSAPEKPK